MAILLTTDFPDLKLAARGKVRDIYDLGDTLLIVTTDRISAFDVIMAEGIPDKGYRSLPSGSGRCRTSFPII